MEYFHKVTDSAGNSDVELQYKLTNPVERKLPLVLAGPILRRVTPSSVTVWLALKHQQTVTLRVLDASGHTVLEGKHETIRVGEFLHLVAVNAKSTNSTMDPGKVYQYEVQLGDKKLSDVGVLTTQEYNIDITYGSYSRPTFTLPPTDLNDIHLMHTSCRKPHAKGYDALPAIDRMLSSAAENPAERPHQLYLTGDQIYADEVGDSLLYLLTDAGETLLGWEERLPKELNFWESLLGQKEYATPTELKPGRRQEVADDQCNFTSKAAKSHLLSLGEYLAMYLFSWSDVLWPPIREVPTFPEVYPGEKTHVSLKEQRVPTSKFSDYRVETWKLGHFQDELQAVRRALANIPTYMIFDDHEVTDDWYLHRRWCVDVLKKSTMGRRVVQNALIAYALCQGWGNQPEHFTGTGTPGNKLLTDVIPDLPPTGDRNRDLVDRLLGIPSVAEDNVLNWPAATDRIPWHYRIIFGPVEAVVLDTRTWRRFKRDKDPPELIGVETYQNGVETNQKVDQLGPVPSPQPELTLLVSAAPLWIAPAHDFAKGPKAFVQGPPAGDVEDWHHKHGARERLFAELATRGMASDGEVQTRVVMLSGDVHYGYTVRMQGWFNDTPWTDPDGDQKIVLANLIASPAKNRDKITESLHNNGYPFLGNTFGQWFSRFLTGQARPPWMICAGWTDAWSSIQSFQPTINGQPVSRPDFESRPESVYVRDLLWDNFESDPTFAEYRSEETGHIRQRLAEIGRDVRVLPRPDWRYRVDFLVDDEQIASGSPPGTEQPVPPPGTPARKEALRNELARLDETDRAKYNRLVRESDGSVKNWGVGREIVGYNNTGEVSFDWSEDDKSAIHHLWWRHTRRTSPTSFQPLSPFPYQRIGVSLDFDKSEYPKPSLGWGP